jgi:UDP:flavonoid glycosyltransferase YjiC (YdhE family)
VPACSWKYYRPSNPDHLWALLDKLGEHNVPFVSHARVADQKWSLTMNPQILSHASPVAQISKEIKQRFADSDKGLIIPWAPQQTVLSHKAVGWFLTHGGAGGTMDALTQGVPM